jgi:hypothetical protein
MMSLSTCLLTAPEVDAGALTCSLPGLHPYKTARIITVEIKKTWVKRGLFTLKYIHLK